MRLSRSMIGTAVFAGSAVVALIVLLLYMQGVFTGGKVAPGRSPLPAGTLARGRATVERREVEEWQEWPGTVTSRTVAQVSPRITARVLEIKVNVGSVVKAGDVVALLDDRDLVARAEQSRSAVTAAEAQGAEAASDLERMRDLLAKGAASRKEFEAAEARSKALDAQTNQARNALKEAQVMLDEAVVRAPFDGVVAEKRAEPGDLAVPGRPILLVHDPNRLRLEAQVPEACAAKAHVGMEVPVFVESLGKEYKGTLDEISPVADPLNRTFLAKATLPSDPGLKPGMFGRFRTACTRRFALLVPASAITKVGQLETVDVLAPDGGVRQRNVRTGKTFGDRIEVLSGLDEGEGVALPVAK
jgi:RND family efflux transporter MFP subunit